MVSAHPLKLEDFLLPPPCICLFNIFVDTVCIYKRYHAMVTKNHPCVVNVKQMKGELSHQSCTEKSHL
jgi:hypothetical protein